MKASPQSTRRWPAPFAGRILWMPELLRVKGEVLLSLAGTTAAADHFHRSLDLAHRQGALSWELRAAMSLGRLDHAQGRLREARHRLASVYERFTEGFETPDLQAARRLLEEWTPGRANGKSGCSS
jgi:predicted ATPase